MCELKFGSGEMLGEQRAFHNVDAAAVKRHGMMTVSATIQAMRTAWALLSANQSIS